MKILIRHKQSGLFAQGPDKWTDDPERAVDFRFLDRAITYVQIWRLQEAEVAFVYENDLSQVIPISMEKAALRCTAA
jgi:hypothetical protein